MPRLFSELAELKTLRNQFSDRHANEAKIVVGRRRPSPSAVVWSGDC